MRTLITASLVLVYTMAFAQHEFPLQKGNVWQYKSTDVINPLPPLEAKVVGDTVLHNGKQYSVISGYIFDSHFMRQELSKVYAYDLSDSAEFLLFDFEAQPGDTLSKHAGGSRTIIMTNVFIDTINNIRHYWFNELAGPPPGGYSFYAWVIQDSFGVVNVTMEPGVSWNLSAALVNGREFGTLTAVTLGDQASVPGQPMLFQNFPNPFNPVTTIRFVLPSKSKVRLEVFNILGQRVAALLESALSPGEHEVNWDAAQSPSGLYVYQLQVGSHCLSRCMLLLR